MTFLNIWLFLLALRNRLSIRLHRFCNQLLLNNWHFGSVNFIRFALRNRICDKIMTVRQLPLFVSNRLGSFKRFLLRFRNFISCILVRYLSFASIRVSLGIIES